MYIANTALHLTTSWMCKKMGRSPIKILKVIKTIPLFFYVVNLGNKVTANTSNVFYVSLKSLVVELATLVDRLYTSLL